MVYLYLYSLKLKLEFKFIMENFFFSNFDILFSFSLIRYLVIRDGVEDGGDLVGRLHGLHDGVARQLRVRHQHGVHRLREELVQL